MTIRTFDIGDDDVRRALPYSLGPTPKMIIFDKDGTLGDCTSALSVWCSKMTKHARQRCVATGIPSSHAESIVFKFHQAIGWDASIDNVVPSAPLSAGTWDEIVDISATSLIDSGLSVEYHEVVEWHQSLGDIHAEDQPLISDLPRFLQHLRHHGILISICTSDSRSSTNACMQNWNITKLVDYSITYDEVEEGKPSPIPVLELCSRAGVSPSECIIVGDTSNDTLAGTRAGVGLVVGVLTGSGSMEQLLENGADIVIPSIRYLKDLLLLSAKSPSSSTSKDNEVSVSLQSSGKDHQTEELLPPIKMKA